MVEWTLTAESLIQTASIIGGGLVFLGVIRRTIKDMEEEIKSIKTDVKILNQTLAQVAVQNSRLDRVEDDIRELRHGKGFVEVSVIPRLPQSS